MSNSMQRLGANASVFAITTAQSIFNLVAASATGLAAYVGLSSFFNASASQMASAEMGIVLSTPPAVTAAAAVALIGTALVRRNNARFNDRFSHASENALEWAKDANTTATLAFAVMGGMGTIVLGMEAGAIGGVLGARAAGQAMRTANLPESVSAAQVVGGTFGALSGAGLVAKAATFFLVLRKNLSRSLPLGTRGYAI